MKVATYNEVRDRYVLVRYDRDDAELVVLLRWGGTEDARAHARLSELDFEPNASPVRASVSWRKHVTEGELGSTCAHVRATFGDDALLDLGASFGDVVHDCIRRVELARYWPGGFVLHVGGTHRCVVFDANVDERDLVRTVSRAREDYDVNDFYPATE